MAEKINGRGREFDALQEATKTGWWRLDTTARTIGLSSFLSKTLGTSVSDISFDSLCSLLNSGKTSDLWDTMAGIAGQQGNYTMNSPQGPVSANITVAGDEILENGTRVVEGTMRCNPVKSNIQSKNTALSSLQHLLSWQKDITNTLLELVDDSDSHSAIPKMLDLMRSYFQASHAYIFTLDEKNRTFSCLYESVGEKLLPLKGALQNLKIEGQEECIDPLLSRQAVFRNGGDEITCDYGIFSDHPDDGPGASMSAPLMAQNGVWGFIKIDIPREDKKWSFLEREAFMAATNVIGVSLALNRSQEKAVENSDFLHRLFSNMPMGYFRLRIVLSEETGLVTDYEYLEVNDKFMQLMERDRSMLVGRMHSDVGPIFVNKLDLQILKKVAFEGQVHITRGQFRTNGRYFNTIIYSPRVGDVVALFNDITDTVIATQALEQSERELKKVYTNIPLGIEIYDKDGFMIDVNDKELEIQGVSDRNVFLGLNLFEHPSLPKFAYDLLKQGKDVTFDVNIASMKVNRQYYGVESEDKLKYLTIKCTVIHNAEGQLENYLLIVIDNTEIYETSARLREFESAFNSVAEIAEVGFFRWNPLKKQYFYSDQWYRNMGIEKKDGAEPSFEDYAHLIHPDDVVAIKEFLKRGLNGEVKSIHTEFRVKSGLEWKWLRTTCHITEYDPDNSIVQFIGINYNINELKQTERRLIEAKSRAEESDRLKSAFLANMSHEIRTPLNAIVGFSSILAETDNKDEKREYTAIIEKNNDHLLHLISDILDLSKIEAGAIEVAVNEVDATELCEQAVQSLRLKSQQGVDMRFIVKDPSQRIKFRSDSKRLNQVLTNFLTNAMKFTSRGHIWVFYKISGNTIEFSVEDTGIGMDPQRASSVFERFVKLDEFVPGTGLGLSICKSIIEKLGGQIGVESEKGQGSRFWFTLPLYN